jgi:hypothetical protein
LRRFDIWSMEARCSAGILMVEPLKRVISSDEDVVSEIV